VVGEADVVVLQEGACRGGTGQGMTSINHQSRSDGT
jgi:hypothetical protein